MRIRAGFTVEKVLGNINELLIGAQNARVFELEQGGQDPYSHQPGRGRGNPGR
jgi:hypothetical protein